MEHFENCQAVNRKLSGSQLLIPCTVFETERKPFQSFFVQSRVGGNLFIPLFKTWDRNYTAETFTFQFIVSNLFQTASRRRTRKEKVFKSDIVREISLDLLYVLPYHNGLRYVFGNTVRPRCTLSLCPGKTLLRSK